MTRLEYMKLTPGQRHDVKSHLCAIGGKTLQEFVAPFVWKTSHAIIGIDGTVRSQNHHGIPIGEGGNYNGIIIQQASRY